MDQIYVVDTDGNKLRGCTAVEFASVGVRERQDLEAWVLDNPAILGEDLLVVTSEYDRFDRSSRRLDVLALDKKGSLVVIELKLDAARTLADQQAIRYAAFCSTMTMDDVVNEHARFHESSPMESNAAIREFLKCDELLELDDQPRIILAAGSFDDQELTATVMWLRSFGMNISCVELTPYRLAESNQLVVVPRVLIPLPEARDYLIRVEKKVIDQRRRTAADEEKAALWQAIAKVFNAAGSRFSANPPRASQFMQVRTGMGDIHYEWMLFRMYLGVGLHFESSDRETNMQRLAEIRANKMEIHRGVEREFVLRDFGKRWAAAEFQLPLDEAESLVDLAPEAARMMNTLIERTWPVVEKMGKGTNE